MGQGQANPQGRRPSWRTALDVLATVALTIAAFLVIWKHYSGSQPSTGPSRRELAVPTSLVDLTGLAIKGDPAAKAVLLEFSDFECPFCAQFSQDLLPQLQKEFIGTGKVAFVFGPLPLPNHKNAVRAAVAADCAGREGGFWGMHDELFRRQRNLEESAVLEAARSLGLREDAFRACLAEGITAWRTSSLEGVKLGIRSTPAFLFGHRVSPNSLRVVSTLLGISTVEEFRDRLNKLLK